MEADASSTGSLLIGVDQDKYLGILSQGCEFVPLGIDDLPPRLPVGTQHEHQRTLADGQEAIAIGVRRSQLIVVNEDLVVDFQPVADPLIDQIFGVDPTTDIPGLDPRGTGRQSANPHLLHETVRVTSFRRDVDIELPALKFVRVRRLPTRNVVVRRTGLVEARVSAQDRLALSNVAERCIQHQNEQECECPLRDPVRESVLPCDHVRKAAARDVDQVHGVQKQAVLTPPPLLDVVPVAVHVCDHAPEGHVEHEPSDEFDIVTDERTERLTTETGVGRFAPEPPDTTDHRSSQDDEEDGATHLPVKDVVSDHRDHDERDGWEEQSRTTRYSALSAGAVAFPEPGIQGIRTKCQQKNYEKQNVHDTPPRI